MLKRAIALLEAAGYALDGSLLRNRATGAPFRFEIMVTTRDQERLALQYAQNVKRAGITADVRSVDATQYEQRRLIYDFDMIQNRWDELLSPGNEQAFYWGSAAADQDGTRNYMGVKSAAADAMIAALLRAQSRAGIRRCRARARSRAAVGHLRDPALSQRRAVDRTLDNDAPPGPHGAVGFPAGDLVDAAQSVISNFVIVVTDLLSARIAASNLFEERNLCRDLLIPSALTRH